LNGMGKRGEDGVVEAGDSLERLTEDMGFSGVTKVKLGSTR
jgi:hypothetical protein